MKNLIVLALLLAPSFAHAVLFNGNFEAGLAGWSIMGDVLTVDSSFGVDPPQGHLQLLLTTAPCQPFCSFSEHPESYSGTNAVSFGFTDFFNTSAAPPGTFQFSGIKQTFVAETDLLLSFIWKFLTDEGGVADYRFYVVDGILHTLSPSSVAVLSPTPFAREYSYETTSFFLPAGPHTIGFGVGDIADTGTDSGLLVDDISFRAVPEPTTWLLFGVGLIALAAVIKFRRSHR